MTIRDLFVLGLWQDEYGYDVYEAWLRCSYTKGLLGFVWMAAWADRLAGSSSAVICEVPWPELGWDALERVQRNLNDRS